MKRTVLITLIALALALAVCVSSNRFITCFVDHARHLRTDAIEAMDEGDVQRAEQTLVELAAHLKRSEPWLEVLCEHEDLHQIKEQIIDAQASIEFGIEDDFYQAIYRFGERLEHIADIENLRLSNLY